MSAAPSLKSRRIREAAIGDAPRPDHDGVHRVAQWIGNSHQWEALRFLSLLRESFFKADEMTQRTFLLLVAEALA